MNVEPAPICPRCGQLDAVRKVSSIVKEGVSVGEYEAYYPGQIAGKSLTVPVKKEMVSKTILAQKLTLPSSIEERRKVAGIFYPPPRIGLHPTLIRFMGLLVGIFGLISFLIFLIGFFFGGEGAATLNSITLVLTVLFVSGSLIADKLYSNALPAEYKEWVERVEKAPHRWAQMYYCYRCDGVFIPGQNRFEPIERMGALLYDK